MILHVSLRRALRVAAAPLFAVLLALPSAGRAQEIHAPGWFKASFLDLRDDVREAAAAKKRVLVFFHLNGCPYCRQFVETTLADRGVAEATRRSFDAIDLNVRGSREVTWIDGATRTERELAEALRVFATPTLIFIDERGAIALRVTGYYPPAAFSAALEYVASGTYLKQPDFQRHLKERGITVPGRGRS